VGRVAEIFDLLAGGEASEVPPDAMFVAEANVISRKRMSIHANVKAMTDKGLLTFDVYMPLERWVALTRHLTLPERDAEDLFVD
jgi:hypothetical protein